MIRAARTSSVFVAGVLHGAPGLLPRRADSPLSFLLFYSRRGRLGGSISPAAVDALASAIQTQEGYYPGSVAYRNNNPGNLVYAGQPGASPGAGGFAQFQTYALGLQAAKNQITLDAERGSDVNGNPINNVSDLITSWAPPSQNNTAAYIASVSLQTGYDPSAPLSSLGAPFAAATPPDSPVFSVDSSISFPPADSADTVDTGGIGGGLGIDLSSLSSGGIDLSGLGLSSSVSPLWIGGGLVGLLVLRKLL